MKCLLREDGMGGLVRTKHVYTYMHMKLYVMYII